MLYPNVKKGDYFAYKPASPVNRKIKKIQVARVTETQFQLTNGQKFRKKDGGAVGYSGAYMSPSCEPWTDEFQQKMVERLNKKKDQMNEQFEQLEGLNAKDFPISFLPELTTFITRAKAVSSSYKKALKSKSKQIEMKV